MGRAIAATMLGPELHAPTDATARVAMSDVPHDQPRSVGSMSLCLTSPGTATITRVALRQPTGDIRVDAFAVRPSPFARGLDGVGTTREPSPDWRRFDPGAVQQVSLVCPTEAQLRDETINLGLILNEFAVQVAWSSGDVSGGTPST
ncbi:MAG TPA: hypothetical protein VFH63_03910 [candidate division Zixibacteria bacterium]|nr:hypothetical protein [candidate division Zixibacteria bacterium]